jgi:DnaK suppressor protein
MGTIFNNFVTWNKLIDMKPEEREKIKEHIRDEISVLEKSIGIFSELLNSEVQSDANDWFSSKESNPSKEINELSLEKARKRIMILKDVLKRIDTPGFGICLRCGNPIPYERLRAIPSTTRCISCH